MQERLLVVKAWERGSILVGVLILSAVLALGAGSMLIVSGVWNSERARESENSKVFYAAESALLMGVRSLRERVPDYFEEPPDAPLRLSSDVSDYMLMDDFLVQVEYTHDEVTDIRRIVSRATAPTGSDTVELAWFIRSASAGPVGGPPSSLDLVNWSETVRPYRP